MQDAGIQDTCKKFIIKTFKDTRKQGYTRLQDTGHRINSSLIYSMITRIQSIGIYQDTGT